jgi:heme o synthase
VNRRSTERHTGEASGNPLRNVRSVVMRAELSAEPTAPGVWLRATALLAVGASTLAIVAGFSARLAVAHRVLALIALAPLVALALAAALAYPWLRRRAYAALAATVAETGIGGLVVASGHSAWAVAAHRLAAGVALAVVVGAAAATLRRRGAGPVAIRDYVTLTKPRIMSLLLLTGVCGLVVGARGVPPLETTAALIAGLGLACGGASALNHLIDRDVDRLMRRTANRPVASGRVPPARALEFGLGLSALSVVLLAVLVNPLAAMLALGGNVFYVVVYTGWLKRSTSQNIVIGGAAGAVPPLVGWAAGAGHLSLGALALFVIIFVWTPPHFWALAMLIEEDYAAARIPMLPVARGTAATTRQILWYSAVLVPVTLAPALLGSVGTAYVIAALALGGWFLVLAWRLRRAPTRKRAGSLFHYSLAYLAALFVAMALDLVL